MLQPHIHPLLDIPIAHFLVHDDPDSGFGDVVDDAGLAMVDFVGHAFLLRAVVDDVDYVSDFVGFHVGAEADHAFGAKFAGESVIVSDCARDRGWATYA